jgi:pimeloyl-ACP methyl ester carboxylesterase
MSETSLLSTTLISLSNGKRLRVARLGAGPPVVMLHGYPDNLQLWSRVAKLVAARFQVIAFDWPGMGYSDEWPGGATPQLLARRLLAILDDFKIDSPVLVGMDMGGQPALAFAAMYPERIERLAVMNSLVFGDEQTSWEIRLLRKYGFNRFALRYLPRIVFRRAEITFVPRGVRLDAALRADFWKAFRRPQVRRFISKMCAGYQGTLSELPALYQEVTCPTLVLWAEHDAHFPLVQAQRLHATISGAQLQVLPSGTHWMPLLRAEELAQRLLDWLSK